MSHEMFTECNVDYINCSKGGKHVMQYIPKLKLRTDPNGKVFHMWTDFIYCEKCSMVMGQMCIGGCKMDCDRKHNIERGTYTMFEREFKYEKCLTCESRVDAPIETEPFGLS